MMGLVTQMIRAGYHPVVICEKYSLGVFELSMYVAHLAHVVWRTESEIPVAAWRRAFEQKGHMGL